MGPPGPVGGGGGHIAIVSAGDGGRRIVSHDLGVTWVNEQRLGGGGDNDFLFRGAAGGAGRLVVAGWLIYSSADGKTWTEHNNPARQWMGGVAFGNNVFVAVGGGGRAVRSTNGTSWSSAANAGNSHIREVVFANGEFWARGDSNTVYHGKDGTSWSTGGTFPSTVHICENVRLKPAGNSIQVSTDEGKTYKTVAVKGGLDEGLGCGRLY